MKRLFLLAAVALLGSCSLAPLAIEARVEGDQVIFEVFAPGGWPWSAPERAHLTVERFMVFTREGPAWVIERSRDPKCARPFTPDATDFPLTYGRLPACFVERMPATPLKNGISYRTETNDRLARGAFALLLTIAPPEENSIPDESDWPMETHPNAVYPVNAPEVPSDPANMILPQPSDVPIGNDGAPAG